MRAKGLGLRAICKALTKAGIKPVRAHCWYQRQVAAMLYRQTYMGHMVIGKTRTGKFHHITDEVQVFANTHPAIIDRELWDAVQKVNGTNRSRGPNHDGPKTGGNLSRLLLCGCCGRIRFHNGRRISTSAAPTTLEPAAFTTASIKARCCARGR
jgi:hypothetical protein